MSRKKGKHKGGKGSAKNTPRRTPQRTQSKRPSRQSWLASECTFALLPKISRFENGLLTVSAATPIPNFSLVDEARWMSNHRTTAFEAGKKLRHIPIQFVSAGHLVGTINEHSCPNTTRCSTPSCSPSSPASTHDTTRAIGQMAIRSPSPAASNASSSADEVVFKGRGQSLLLPSTPLKSAVAANGPSASPRPAQVSASTDVQYSASMVKIEARPSGDVSIRIKHTSGSASPKITESDNESVVHDHFAKRRGGRPIWEGATTPWQHRSKLKTGWMPSHTGPNMDDHVDHRAAAMDDYMQNVEEFGLTDDMINASGFSRREMDLDAGSHNDWESMSESHHEENEHNTERNNSWDSDMLQDFEYLSTSSDVQDTVVQILSKRTRKSGLQYLCVYDGSVIDDARWLPVSFLKLSSEKDLIRAFEDVAESRAVAVESSSDSADTEYEEDDLEDLENAGSDLDDETIARILQKQEEFGLDSEEVLLYDGDDSFDRTDSRHYSSADFSRRTTKTRRDRMKGSDARAFPSASAMADALAMDPYGGFDIMDTERPSLKPKKKGRRGQLPPELEDPDLNEQLQGAWEADRAKKRIKKAEREALRQQGLLGRKGKSANLKIKYKDGIVIEDVVEEIRDFMLGVTQSLSLPPMDARRRATVHQIAAFFGLSSRSRGGGQDRFTILSKTSHTRIMDDDDFDQAILSKGFQKRMRGPLQGQKGAPRESILHHGKRPRPKVGYQDGDTVGANAPELGPENKGHALMMKMGWSKGMALGTEQNQGILYPIAHTVKINKAGL